MYKNTENKLKIEITADDFGRSAAANAGILVAFDQGLISSTSLMVNMPGFEDACKLIATHDMIKNVGVHLNFTEGAPLTAAIRKVPLFCDAQGRFVVSGLKTFFPFTSREETLLYDELDAQIRKCIDAGIMPCRIDSHMHRHTNWQVGKMVIQLAKKHKIPGVRLSGNCRRHSLMKQLFVTAYNFRLRLHGLAYHDFFGAVHDLNRCHRRLKGGVEIMVHPTLGSDNVMRDAESGMPLADHIGRFQNYIKNVQPI